MKNKKIKTIRTAVISSVLILALLFGTIISLAAYDGAVNQSISHVDEKSMYLYTFDIYLENPCNSADMDKDAVCVLWFDFKYKENNGYGAEKTYRFDMSWQNGRNLNSEILNKNFIRPNDNACYTQMSVWVPGIISNVHIKLNMDGGERLGFTVNGIYLNGFRINTDTDYVSSAYYDSEADIPCFVPKAAAICPDGTISAGAGIRDQYNGVFSDASIKSAQDSAVRGDYSMIYHYDF